GTRPPRDHRRHTDQDDRHAGRRARPVTPARRAHERHPAPHRLRRCRNRRVAKKRSHRMSNRPKRARRCQLSVPGSSEKMLAKAAGLTVDHVFLDLEDAVAPSAKPGARGTIGNAVNELEWKPKTLCVRVNDVTTQWCFEDIIEVVSGAGHKLDTIMLTK